jgi:tRNA A-37 threonylcarbamoyl transferase component Bud32
VWSSLNHIFRSSWTRCFVKQQHNEMLTSSRSSNAMLPANPARMSVKPPAGKLPPSAAAAAPRPASSVCSAGSTSNDSKTAAKPVSSPSRKRKADTDQSSEKLTQYVGMERYKKLDKLGEGTYGVVYEAVDRATQTKIALKKIRMDANTDEGIPATALREISILIKLKNCPHVVPIYDVQYEPNRLYVALKLMDQRDLKKRLDDYNAEPLPGVAAKPKIPITHDHIKKWMWQLCKGLAMCHAQGVMHRDLKPQNLLLDANDDVFIGDFGLARNFIAHNKAFTHEVVTLWYRAPEILLGTETYTASVDIWSVGCIFGELLLRGQPLFPGDSEIDELFRIFRVLGTPNEAAWPGVSQFTDFKTSFPKWPRLADWRHLGWTDKSKPAPLAQCDPLALDLLSKMLVYEPTQRLTARGILKHPYFAARRPEAPAACSPAVVTAAVHPGIATTQQQPLQQQAPLQVSQPLQPPIDLCSPEPSQTQKHTRLSGDLEMIRIDV